MFQHTTYNVRRVIIKSPKCKFFVIEVFLGSFSFMLVYVLPACSFNPIQTFCASYDSGQWF